MNPDGDFDHLELAKSLMRKAHSLNYQKEHGGSFARAWNAVLLDHPEVASREELTPTDQPAFVASQAPYRYDPSKPPALLDGKNLSSFFPSKPPRDDGEQLMLVMASNGEIVGLELI